MRLADYPQLEQFLAEELGYGLDEATSDFILNGGTDETLRVADLTA